MPKVDLSKIELTRMIRLATGQDIFLNDLIKELEAARKVVEAAKELIFARPNWRAHMASLILRAEEYDEVIANAKG